MAEWGLGGPNRSLNDLYPESGFTDPLDGFDTCPEDLHPDGERILTLYQDRVVETWFVDNELVLDAARSIRNQLRR